MTRFIFSVLISFFLFVAFIGLPTTVHAQVTSQYHTPTLEQDVPQNLHTWSQTVMIEVLASVICQLSGIDPTHPNQPCLAPDTTTGKIGYAEPNGGAVGFMTNMIAVLYTPPTHTGGYFIHLAQNFGVVKPAYAQGMGFAGISPLMQIWATFRDMVYLIFVILFIVVGLAIMLRIKIDPRTVMSIENSIPKLVVGLLIVTFSFALSGLLIDLMWISTYVVTNVISNSTNNAQSASVISQDIYTPPFGVVNNLYKNVSPFVEASDSTDNARGFGSGIWNIAQKSGFSVQQVLSSLLAPKDAQETFKLQATGECSGFTDLACWAGKVVGGTIGTILSQIVGWLISWIFGLLAILVVLVAILYSLFLLWIALIKAYVFTLIDIVLSPFWVIGDILPDSPINFSAWMRDMLANLSVFPVTIAMFLLGRAFMDAFATAPTDPGAATLFVPPLIGTPNEGSAIGSLIGMGIILLTPQVVNMMREIFKAPEFKYTAAIGQSIGFGAKAIGAGPGKGWEFLTREADPYKHKNAGWLRRQAMNWISGYDIADENQGQGRKWRRRLASTLLGPSKWRGDHH